MAKPEPLLHGQYYHIYNRGNSGEALFREGRNYRYFLELYAKYVEPIAETYAYCLMPNHFHLLVRVRDPLSLAPSEAAGGRSGEANHALARLFGTYTKAFNKAFERTGSLFAKPFRRVLVDNDRYLIALVIHIHRNPEKHGFGRDFRTWPHSSFRAHLSKKETRIQREAVLDWFGGRAEFEASHGTFAGESLIERIVAGDNE